MQQPPPGGTFQSEWKISPLTNSSFVCTLLAPNAAMSVITHRFEFFTPSPRPSPARDPLAVEPSNFHFFAVSLPMPLLPITLPDVLLFWCGVKRQSRRRLRHRHRTAPRRRLPSIWASSAPSRTPIPPANVCGLESFLSARFLFHLFARRVHGVLLLHNFHFMCGVVSHRTRTLHIQSAENVIVIVVCSSQRT